MSAGGRRRGERRRTRWRRYSVTGPTAPVLPQYAGTREDRRARTSPSRARGADRAMSALRAGPLRRGTGGHLPHGPAPHSDDGHLDAELAAILALLAKAAGMTSSGPLNIGHPDDYRVPDRAVLRERQHATYVPTAAVVVEIVSPDDETFEKLLSTPTTGRRAAYCRRARTPSAHLRFDGG